MEKTEYPADTQSIHVVVENTRDDDRILPYYDIEVQQEDGGWVKAKRISLGGSRDFKSSFQEHLYDRLEPILV